MRPVENPTELLERAYTEAKKSGLFEKIISICRLLGSQSIEKSTQEPLYRLTHGKISLFFDSLENSITVYYGNDLVCCSEDGNQLFIYGAWVRFIEELYRAITTKDYVLLKTP